MAVPVCQCGGDEYTGHSFSCAWSPLYEMSLEPDEPEFFLPPTVIILFPDAEREIPIAADGKPRKTPGYVYEQTITGEWFAVRT